MTTISTTTPARVDELATVSLATLKYLRLDPNTVETRALVAIAQRYRLDPLVGEVQLIQTRQGPRVYISRDGMIALAHRSGQLDGIVVDEERRNTRDDGWTAYVSVYRKDCKYPFRYGAQCKDSEAQAKAGNGPEMALARAERRALRRAFAIPADEGFDPDDPGEQVSVSPGWDTRPARESLGGGGEHVLPEAPSPPSEGTNPVEDATPAAPPSVALDGYPLVGELLTDKDWWTERCRRAGVTPARVLQHARGMANELGVDPPRSVEDIGANETLAAAALEWLDTIDGPF